MNIMNEYNQLVVNIYQAYFYIMNKLMIVIDFIDDISIIYMYEYDKFNKIINYVRYISIIFM
jgi:hypothetical protein